MSPGIDRSEAEASESKPGEQGSRRRFIKAAAYVAPVLVTLAAAPALAQTGSSAPINCPPGTVPGFIPGIGWQCLT
ncbi:MAG: hypothetical protein R3E10_11485 [Gemmatimonadota bacterium]